jgi:hypothetical protein
MVQPSGRVALVPQVREHRAAAEGKHPEALLQEMMRSVLQAARVLRVPMAPQDNYWESQELRGPLRVAEQAAAVVVREVLSWELRAVRDR